MKFTRLFVATLAMAGLVYGCGDDSGEESGAPQTENTAELCADGQDNDGNGKADCDEDTCKEFDNCKGQEKECPAAMPTGKKDCTCDKTKGEWTNCQDDVTEKECPATMPAGKKDCTCDKTKGEWTNCQDDTQPKTEICDNKADDDEDGKVDCDDEDCAEDAACKQDAKEICDNKADDDEDGKVDCDDEDCAEDAACKQDAKEICDNKADDDEDGKIDCDDEDCAEDAACKQDAKEICDNKKDDDGDGKIDCDDDDCKDDAACKQAAKEICDNKKDDDGDSKIDCDDDDCKDDAACKQAAKEICDNKKDDDGDSKIDCDDDDCKNDAACKAAEDKDENKNHMKDSKEPHISSATACTYHSDCADTNFCDHFIAGGTKIGKCADKCTGNDDCMEGFICRPDGRCAAEAFETVWKTSADNEEIELPSGGNDAVCKATVDWGDGSAAEEVKECPKKLGDLKHKYAKAGEYHVKITGTWDGWCMGTGHIDATCLSSNDMAAKLIEVVSYGPVGLGVQGFASAKNLAKLSTIDIPDASKLGQKNGENVYADDMFYGCENLEKGLAKWDISNVTGLKDFFAGAKKFNENIYGWDTSSVTDFYGMFWGAEALTTNPANSWDLSNAQSMGRMFSDTTKASLNFQHTKASKPEKITSCEGIKDMYTGSAVDCDIVKIAGEDVEALKNCKKSDYKAECK